MKLKQKEIIKMNIPLIDLQAQYKSLEEELNKAALEVLSSAKYIMGENVLNLKRNCKLYRSKACNFSGKWNRCFSFSIKSNGN